MGFFFTLHLFLGGNVLELYERLEQGLSGLFLHL